MRWYIHCARTIWFKVELSSIWPDHTDHYGVVAGASGVAVGADSKFGGGGICRGGLVYLTPGIIFPWAYMHC